MGNNSGELFGMRIRRSAVQDEGCRRSDVVEVSSLGPLLSLGAQIRHDLSDTLEQSRNIFLDALPENVEIKGKVGRQTSFCRQRLRLGLDRLCTR